MQISSFVAGSTGVKSITFADHAFHAGQIWKGCFCLPGLCTLSHPYRGGGNESSTDDCAFMYFTHFPKLHLLLSHSSETCCMACIANRSGLHSLHYSMPWKKISCASFKRYALSSIALHVIFMMLSWIHMHVASCRSYTAPRAGFGKLFQE